MQGGVSEKTLGGVSEKSLDGRAVNNNVQLAFIQTNGVQGMCETERKNRRRQESISGAMDNVQRDKYHCLHRHAVKMTSLSGSS